jgi:predicted enzyme related to lactoylglutathione lyase
MNITSIAVRVCQMDAMVAFYSEAFNVQFENVVTSGFASKFGSINGINLKFVPIRDKVDFENYPIHQLGFSVPDIEKVIKIALKHGGKTEGNTAVRDPDGNTLELYSE